MEGRCYCCGKLNHKSPKCHYRNKPKSQWAINKMPELVQAQNLVAAAATMTPDDMITTQPVPTSTDTNINQATSPFSWMAVQTTGVAMSQVRDIMKDWILLNSQSLADVFCNLEFVKDIHDTGEILSLTMNTGTLTTSSKATVPGYGKVWFASHAITNHGG